MTNLEITAHLFLKLFYGAIPLAIFLFNIWRYCRKVRQVVMEEKRAISNIEFNVFYEFQKELKELNLLSEMTSGEKIGLMEGGDAGCFTLNDQTLIQLGSKYSSFQNSMNEFLEYKRILTDEKFERSQREIDLLRNEYSRLKMLLEDKLRLSEDQLEPKSLVDCSTQTQTSETENCWRDSVEDSIAEAYDNESIAIILGAVQECILTIINDSKRNWRSSVMELSSCVQLYHNSLKQNLLDSINENVERAEQLQVDSLMIQTEVIEKQLLGVFLFLDRQLVDVQAVSKTLKFFNRKFVHFAEKCDIRWQESCSRHEATCDQVEEAQQNLQFGSNRLSVLSCSLTQHSSDVKDLIKTVEEIAAIIDTRKGPPPVNEMTEVCNLLADINSKVKTVEANYGLKLREVSNLLEPPFKKLMGLLRYIENLEVLNDLVKNIACTYESMFTTPDEKNWSTGNDGITSLQPSATAKKGGVSYTTISPPSEIDCVQDVDTCTEMSYETKYDNEGKGANNEDDSSLRAMRMISKLDSVIKKAAVDLSKSKHLLPKRIENKLCLGKPGESTLTTENLKAWRAIPSELSISDMNSDCLLVLNSSSASSEED